ncbi:MAG: ABC transporter ATP-binding protein [Anaerolineaceae bacterium]|nr:ABC transporter ATP-binding protein [Anaerolineaceae bacterium]
MTGTEKSVSAERDDLSVEMYGIWKRFPGVIANQDVNLDLRVGEVHSLLGENGAGKSTLMHILSGIYRPDAGTIKIAGKTVDFRSPAQAIEAGIGMVHQHFKLVETMTVAENIHLGWNETPRNISGDILARRTEKLSQEFGLYVDPNTKIWQLSTGEQQRVEILRVLARGAKVLILDEPTSVLTPAEAEELFKGVRTLAAGGRTVVLISHKLEEVMAVSDRITVLRNGKVVARRMKQECDQNTLATLLIGQEMVSRLQRNERPFGKPVLEISNLSALNDRGLPALLELNMVLREGEILGIAGVSGNGQVELGEVITCLRPVQKGVIRIEGKDLTGKTPAHSVEAGVGHIPEDRVNVGLAAALSVADNAILREYKSKEIARGIVINSREAFLFAKKLVEQANVRVPNTRVLVRHLSGGNQQRLLANREIRIATHVLIAVHPTQGLDIGATEVLRNLLIKYRNEGGAVLLISEDLDEILVMSDRIAVMYNGRITGEFNADQADRSQIGLLMGGGKTSASLSASFVKEQP